MGILQALFDFLSSLFGSSKPKPSPEPLEQSEETIQYEKYIDGKDTIEVSLYSTKKLHETNGVIPEQMAARQIRNAFEKTDYGYKITFNHDPVSIGTEKAVCAEDCAYGQWSKMVYDMENSSKDSNLLLTAATGGGCSGVGGKAGVVGAREIYSLKLIKDSGSGKWYNNMSAILHEMGHNLALSHDHDDSKEGQQHAGTGWNDEDGWHRTPMCASNGSTNICGEEIEAKESDTTVQELYFHDCAIGLFDVK